MGQGKHKRMLEMGKASRQGTKAWEQRGGWNEGSMYGRIPLWLWER